ncbi:hypothetical protein BH10ACT3_BH10ACT3_15560 [soil metagenome]
MAVPEEYVAIWARATIAFDDEPPGETQDVRWVQTGQLYCDLRVGRDGDDDVSFAGDCTALEPREDSPSPGVPRLRWSHELELERDAGPDTLAGVDEGAVWWDGDDLIERGTFDGPDGPITYTEVWQRLDPGEGVRLALASTDGTGRMAMLGDHCLTVCDDRVADAGVVSGQYLARYQVRTDGEWVTELSLGDVSELPPTPVGEFVEGELLEWAGRSWSVIEFGGLPDPR